MPDTRVLLLHGLEHHRPRNHWLWWLAEELRQRRVPVQYPQLPEPDQPDPAAWTEHALTELEMLGGGHTVIAHSLGTVLWRHLASQLPAHARPSRVALVSPPSVSVLERVAPAWASLNQGFVDAPHTIVVGCETDPFREEPLMDVAAALGVRSVTIPGHGHLTAEDGFGPYPGALAWALGVEAEAWERT